MKSVKNSKPTILIVDDTPTNLTLLMGLLKDDYHVKIANNGRKALTLAELAPPDLVLLDIMMPEMDGYEVCTRLKLMSHTKHIPVIFLTAKSTVEDEEHGFHVGAVDFIHKPISPPIVKTRIETHLNLKKWQDSLIDDNQSLELEVLTRLKQVSQLKDAMIYVMVSMAEFRDECTGNHIRRTQAYVRMLAEHLANNPKFASVLTPDKIDLIAKSAPLHDVGKITIPDEVLLKPDKLTKEEFEIMKTHPFRGYEILKQAAEYLGTNDDFLNNAMDIALYHHERWDGAGYPYGLEKDDIPLSARIMAVADVFDALLSERPYKIAKSYKESMSYIESVRGKHLDPDVVDALFATEKQCVAIANSWPD